MESRNKSNIQKAKMFLDKAYKAENELNSALSQIAIILQNYTSVEIHGDWVTSDQAIISWDDNEYNHNTIPVESFLDAIKYLRPDRDKLSEEDLKKISI